MLRKLMLMLSYLVQLLSATGVLEVQLVSYNNPSFKVDDGSCCDDLTPWSSCKPGQCDPWVELCVDYVTPSSSNCVIGNSKTKTYDNTDSHTFSAPEGSFSFNFQDWKGGLQVTITVMDDDTNDGQWFGNTSPDLLDTIKFQVTSLAGSNGRPSVKGTTLNKGNTAKLVFEVLAYCDKNYYNDCAKYCKPDPNHYTCDNQGDKVCLPAWKGPNCDISVDDDCYGNVCSNGATCIDGSHGYTCACAAGFTGLFCDLEILTTTSQTQTTAEVTSSDTGVIATANVSSRASTTTSATTKKATTIPTPSSHDTTFTSISPTSHHTTGKTFVPLFTTYKTMKRNVTAVTTRKKAKEFAFPMIAAAVGGGIVLLTAVTSIVCLAYKRCKRRKKGRHIQKSHKPTRIQVEAHQNPPAANVQTYRRTTQRHVQVFPARKKFKPQWVNKEEWKT